MGFLQALAAILTSLAGPAKWVAGEVRGWADRRADIQEATLQKELAKITAEAELSAWKLKADVEWDLAWAGQAQSSWKDEYLLILWSLPLASVLLAFYVPPYRDSFLDTLRFFQDLNPDIIPFYLMGWSIIFAAVFGFKQAASMMMPGKIGTLVKTLGTIEDDIPDEVADKATQRIKEQLAKR